jgi:hypothetical protein
MRIIGGRTRAGLTCLLLVGTSGLAGTSPAKAGSGDHIGPQPKVLSSVVRVSSEAGYNAWPDGFQLPDGTIRITYTHASSHDAPGGSSPTRSSYDGGKTWSAPVTAGTRRSPVQLPGGLIVAASMEPMGSSRGAASTYSTDGGLTWHSNGLAANGGGFTADSSPMGLARLTDGSLLMSVWGYDTGDATPYVRYLRSTDSGATWAIQSTIKDAACPFAEPSLAAASDGTIVSAMRCDNANGSDGTIYVARSFDLGKTWSGPTPAFPHASGFPKLAFLPDGSLVAMYRSAWTDFYPFRYARSLDNGSTWIFGLDFTGDWQRRMMYGDWIIGPDATVVGVVYALEDDWYNSTVYYRTLAMPTSGVEVRGMQRAYLRNNDGTFVHLTGRVVYVDSEGIEHPQATTGLTFTLRSFEPISKAVVIDHPLITTTDSQGLIDVTVPLWRHGELVMYVDGMPGTAPYMIGTFRSGPTIAVCPTAQTAQLGVSYNLHCQGGMAAGLVGEFQRLTSTGWVHQRNAWADSTGLFQIPITITTTDTYRLVIRTQLWTDPVWSLPITVTVNTAPIVPNPLQGTALGWGQDADDQSTVPADLKGVTAVAAGGNHSLALKGDGTVVAWGATAAPPTGLSGVIAIAASTYSHNLALKSDGTVVGWNGNAHGETTIPAGLSGVTAIAAGCYHSLALKSDGTVVAWGWNNEGQLDVPTGLSSVKAIAAGCYFSLALKSDGTVVAWGNNDYGQTSVPAGLSGVVAISASRDHCLALKSDGTVVAWGNNSDGQTSVPAGLSGVVGISAGGYHSLALKSDGTVVAWGRTAEGQTTGLADLRGVAAVSAGGRHSLALQLAYPEATFWPISPTRILDTREGNGLGGAFTSRVARTFQVTGRGGIPAGAVAVTGNLTVTQQTALGYLYIGPVATNAPTSSTLNFPKGDDRANAVTVALGAGGTLSITYYAGIGASTQVIFDVTGYFTPDATGATYMPLDPTRLLDTRAGNGLSGGFASRVARTFQVTGRGGVPANAVAVTGNLTVTGQTALGYLFMGPVATNAPTSSTLNFPRGDDRANAVTVQLGAGGTLSITYYAGIGASTHVIFDVTGYFTPDATGATYMPVDPARLLDTRSGIGLIGAFTSRVARTFQVTVPANAVAVTGNLTVTGQTALGYLYIGPVATNSPTSSTLNFPKADNRANSLAVKLGTGGTLSVTYYAGTGAQAHVIFDVSGYFSM